VTSAARRYIYPRPPQSQHWSGRRQSFVAGNFPAARFYGAPTATPSMRDLGNLAGRRRYPAAWRAVHSNAARNAINDNGQVVGWTEAVVELQFRNRAFLWDRSHWNADWVSSAARLR